MLGDGCLDEGAVKSIFKSDTFPTTGWGYAHDLTDELKARIEDAFFSFEWEGSELKKEFESNGFAQIIPITYLEHWAAIRDVDEKLGLQR